MKRAKQLRKAFGRVDDGLFAAFPAKFSNVQVSRLIYGNQMGCSVCFPHGPETANSHWANQQRSWKRYRRTQWKP